MFTLCAHITYQCAIPICVYIITIGFGLNFLSEMGKIKCLVHKGFLKSFDHRQLINGIKYLSGSVQVQFVQIHV